MQVTFAARAGTIQAESAWQAPPGVTVALTEVVAAPRAVGHPPGGSKPQEGALPDWY